MKATSTAAVVLLSLVFGAAGARVNVKKSSSLHQHAVQPPKTASESDADSLAEVNETQVDSTGVPRCCHTNCCKKHPFKRDECILKLGICKPAPQAAGPPATCGGKARGAPCKKSFRYKFKKYTGCTTKDSKHGRPWCYTTRGVKPTWGYCDCGPPKKKEVCCMCRHTSWRAKDTWFQGPDYNAGNDAVGACKNDATGCGRACHLKGASFAGCWKAGRMKHFREQVRAHPRWTIQGMPDNWQSDNGNDISW